MWMKPLALLKLCWKPLYISKEKKIDIITSGRESHRISIILSVIGNGYKLHKLLIIKGEPDKLIEKELRPLPYIRDKKIFINCQPDACCTLYIFKELVNLIFKPYEIEYGDKCLLIMDKSASYVSKKSILFLEEKSDVLIPFDLTSECQPLEIPVKLKQARLNIIDYITRVWYAQNIIKPIIISN